MAGLHKDVKYLEEINVVRRQVLIVASSLLFLVMAFTGFLNYMTFAENYNKSLVNTYSVASNESVRKIEYSLHYGKPIENYYGMNTTLNELKRLIPELEEVSIVSPNGNILYDLNGFVRNQKLADELYKTAVFKQGTINEKLSYQFYDQKTYVFNGIYDNQSNHVASLEMVFPQEAFLQMNSHFTQKLLIYLASIALIALITLSLFLFKSQIVNPKKLINKKKLLIVLITVIGFAQVTYSGVNYTLFKSAYIEMADTSKVFIEKIISDNIESIYEKGLNLENIDGLDTYLNSINESLPQIESVQVTSSSVDAVVSSKYIEGQMSKILLDMVTVLIISLLFMTEISLLAVTLMTRALNKSKYHQEQRVDDIKTNHGLIRGIAFFINLCAFMSLTFIPIFMESIYRPVWGLPKEVVLGLPLSAEMFGGILGIVAIFMVGSSISKQGWKTIMYQGAVLLAVGNLLSGLGFGPSTFILARALAGFGLAFLLMSLRSLVVSMPENNVAIAEFSAGAIAGLNCGAVMGGMLADRIGYSMVFALTAILAIIPIIFVGKLMGNLEIEQREVSHDSAWRKFVYFISEKKAIFFLFCIFVPYFISGAFLDYFFPLFASGQELTQSDISRGFLINGLFIIYLGPFLTGFITRKLGSTQALIVSMSIVILALINFTIFNSITAAFVTLALLGIAESFGVSIKTTYFLNLRGMKDLEINQAIAYFSVMVNISRMAGPLIFGLVLTLGVRMGVGLIATAIFLLLLVFVSAKTCLVENT